MFCPIKYCLNRLVKPYRSLNLFFVSLHTGLLLATVAPVISYATPGSEFEATQKAEPLQTIQVQAETVTSLQLATAPQDLPEAENIDLKEVVEEPATPSKPAEPAREKAAEDAIPQPSVSEVPPPREKPKSMRMGPPIPDDLNTLVLLGTRVPAATSTRLAWVPGESFAGIAVPTPVLVVNGAEAGLTLCLTAAIHGDELNGIEVVRRILYDIDVTKLKGTLIGVPIVNLQGFHRSSRYLADRRDLNRHFPGSSRGSSASRIANSFFKEVISQCDALVDVHTGSFHRTNLPQIRANLNNKQVKEFSQKFGATVVLHSVGGRGTLRRAAVEAGIPAVTIEAGEPMRLQESAVGHGVKSILSLLDHLDMYGKFSLWGDPEPVYYHSAWIRAQNGGILMSKVKLGERVDEGDVLGTVTDPITNARSEIHSPFAGRVLGMAVNQVVMPGFAAYRIGKRSETPDPEPIILPATNGDNGSEIIVSPENGDEDPGDQIDDSEE